MIEFVESSIAHLGPIMLPKVRHDRPQRPWWESARLHSMRHYLGEGDRLLDVGAEMGDMSALFASWGVDVFLVEPNPKAWPWIFFTFDANDLMLSIKGWFMGLLGAPGDEGQRQDTLVDWFVASGPFGYSWPAAVAEEPDPETGFHHLDEHASVNRVMTVDQLVEESGFVPTAITVDIEGGEIKMIEGMVETLAHHRPKVWMSVHHEFIIDRYGLSPQRIWDVFDEYNYDRIYLAHDHESHFMLLPKEMGWRW